MFKIHTGLTFDPLGAAESAADYTLTFLLNPARLTRLIEQKTYAADQLSVFDILGQLQETTKEGIGAPSIHNELKRIVRKLFLHHLMALAADDNVMSQVKAAAWLYLDEIKKEAEATFKTTNSPESKAHCLYQMQQIEIFEESPGSFKVPSAPALPDGSPIGCGE